MLQVTHHPFCLNLESLGELRHPLRIGWVRSRFNEKITQSTLDACLGQLAAYGLPAEQIAGLEVPGALEIPIALQTLALSPTRFDALIALGCIIRGETYHFELVANESAAGLNRISLDHQLPIVNTILTVESREQAWARAKIKGAEAAHAAVEMALLQRNYHPRYTLNPT
jgi:6,7-dimethyl-8-ribityllumazine synthase